MIQSKTTTIDDRRFVLRQLPAKLGRAVLLRLGRPIAAAIQVSGAGKGVELNLAAAAKALTEEDLDFICETFAAVTFVDVVDEVANKTHQKRLSQVFDDAFAGPAGYRAMWGWLRESIEFNFGNFTDVLGTLAGTIAPTTAADPASPSTSIGG